jgi:hypothetical protein
MRNTLQPLVVAVTSAPKRSTSQRPRPATYSPQRVGRRPEHWNGVAWVPWARPQHAADRRSRLATTLTLTGLGLIAITLLTPGFGFALVQWIVIFLAVVGITVFLHRQFARAGH